MILLLHKAKVEWLVTSLHLLEWNLKVFNPFHRFLDLGIKVQTLSLATELIRISQMVIIINLEETNQFQVSVNEIIGRLESISDLHLEDSDKVKDRAAGWMEAKVATLWWTQRLVDIQVCSQLSV